MRAVSVAVMTMGLVATSAIGSAGAEEAVAPATGTWTDIVYEPGIETHRGADDYTVEGSVIQGLLEMSEPRLSGTLVLKGDSDDYGRGSSSDLRVLSGSGHLESDEGAWAGVFTLVQHQLDYQEHILELQVWLAGEGANEGYSAFLTREEMTDDGLQVEAVIYPGDPPSLTGPQPTE